MTSSPLQKAQILFAHTHVLKILSGILLLFGCSQITIPLQPVPITLQTIGVMLIGLTYSPKDALWATLTFLAMGALGLPMFAGFSFGLAVLMGNTGGYLIGFLVAAVSMAYLQKHFFQQTYWHVTLNCLIGTLIVFICGVSWLSSLIGFSMAIQYGLLPFIIPGLLKAVILSSLLSSTRLVLQKKQNKK